MRKPQLMGVLSLILLVLIGGLVKILAAAGPNMLSGIGCYVVAILFVLSSISCLAFGPPIRSYSKPDIEDQEPSLRTDGFYSSGPVEWEDWHAGVHMCEIHYLYWRFFPNGDWIRCHRYEPDFAFWQFTESLTNEAIEEAKHSGRTPQIDGGLSLFQAGTYAIQGHTLIAVNHFRVPLHPSGEQVHRTETKWRLLAGELVPQESGTGIERWSFLERPSATPQIAEDESA